jgi:Holliday junction resolvase-like predicted endonuclease
MELILYSKRGMPLPITRYILWLHMEPNPYISKKQQNKVIGDWGETIVANYLQNKGFIIVGRNYRQKWGEIDVIAQYANKTHFVEVKTVSYETRIDLERAVSYGTWRPEENVHPLKLQRLARTIETWLAEFNWEGDWQIDVAAVRIVPRETYATIKYLNNIVL